MSLTEEQVTAKNFQEFYTKIRPYLNGSFPTPIVNKFSKGDLYSTDEKIIGQWVDGKPIWQKTITGLNMPMAWDGQYCSKAFLQYDVSNIDKLIYAEGVGISGEQIANPTHCFSLGAYKTSTGIQFISFSGATLQQITMRYTKSTDSPISIGDGNDYSTDEQVVGTWIDGKPVYQKTLVVTNLTSETTEVNPNISNLNKYIKIEGVAHRADEKWFTIVSVLPSSVLNDWYISLRDFTGTSGSIMRGPGYTGTTALSEVFVTLQYTKTND